MSNRKATFELGEALDVDCPNCGADAGTVQAVYLVSHVGERVFTMCAQCWPRVRARQLGALQLLLRQRYDPAASRRAAAARIGG